MNALSFPEDQNPFWHYQSSFDVIELMQKYALRQIEPAEGLITNYLGVKFHPRIYPAILEGAAGTVEPMPWPNNWHADLAEWSAALRAVDLSIGGRFVAVELGCGWGCWLNITGSVARRAGKPVVLVGVEGDEGHVLYTHEALRLNGFQPHESFIYHGIAGSSAGTALFPRRDVHAAHWGLEAVLNPSKEQIENASRSGSHDVLNIIPLPELIDRHGPIDLLHVDIQGGEADLLEASIGPVNQSVRYIVVGTHSRLIEGRLEKLMLDNGWKFEMDRPAISSLEHGAPTLKVDGVQGWRNPRL